MATKKKLSSPTLYDIAWIAALPIERAAATAFLNDSHDEPEGFYQRANDANAYDWGEIGCHNVVIASLPAGVYGTISAATTVSNLLSSLPHVRIGLLVGIGGGIPRPDRDIRLGDIVVSQPDGRNGGVMQYDLGKAKANQTWEQQGTLNMPPMVLLHALGKLQAYHEIKGSRMAHLLGGLVTKGRGMKNYVHQGPENDRLFSSKYDHSGGSSCNACDSSQEVERPERETTDPKIHYGTVASGNTLVKDASVRNRILQTVGEECLCVEMEAAGLMNNFPCLVIRGICDYADSHKNDRWQRYAAATAAAFAVELLGCVPVRQLGITPSALELMKSISMVDHKVTHLKKLTGSSYSQTALNRLPTAIGAAHDSFDSWLQTTCMENTRVDVLREIQEWASDPDSNSTTLFWLNGMAGTGKSTISRTVASRLAEDGTLGGSFFFKKGETDRANPSKLFTTLAAGLSRWQSAVSQHIEEAIMQNPQIFDQMPHQQFSKLILEPLSKATLCSQKPIVIVIDALDECQHRSITSIITDILPQARGLRHPRLKFFLTSRPELPIQAGFPSVGRRKTYEDMILQNVPRDIIQKDLETFLWGTIGKIRDRYNDGSSRLPPSWPGTDAIQRLVDMAIPLFIVASTFCRFLEDRRLGNPRRQMDKILGVQDRAHASMLDEMYLAVLNQQFGDALGSCTMQEKRHIIDEFRSIVGSIILLSSPLPIPALAQLLNNDQSIDEFQETIENRLDHLHSVLSVPPLSKRSYFPVRVLHLSFRDFLVDNKHRDINPFWVDEAKTHLVLGQRCLGVMRASLRENMCGLEHPGILKTNIDQETVDRCLPAHVQYVCLHWIGHMEQAHIDAATANSILAFLEMHLLHWLEALSLMGRVLESVVMVERLKQATMDVGCLRLSSFLDDLIRFTGANAKVLMLAPLQIYSSALLFSPRKSAVRNSFRQRIPDWISVQPPVEDNWGHCLQTLEIRGQIEQVIFSPDSKLIASWITTGELRFWDVKTGTESSVPVETDSLVLYMGPDSISFSADADLIFILSHGYIRVVRVITGECIQKLEDSEKSLCSLRPLSPDLVASGSERGAIQIWEADTGRLVATLEGHKYAVRVLAVSTNQRLLASGSDDGTINIWRRDTWAHLVKFEAAEDEAVSRITFSGDSALIAAAIGNTGDLDLEEYWAQKACGRKGVVAVFEIESGRQIQELCVYEQTPDLIFRRDSELVVSDPKNLSVSVWESKTGHLLHELRGHSSLTALSSDATLAISTSSDGLLQLWNVDTGECLQSLNEPRLANDFVDVAAMALSPDKRAAITTDWESVKVWEVNIDKDKLQQPPERDHPGSHGTASSGSNLNVFFHEKSSTVTIWDEVTGRCLQRFIADGVQVQSVVFSADSKILLLLTHRSTRSPMDKGVLVWDIETCAQLLALEITSEQCFFLATLSPTLELIVMTEPYDIRVWHFPPGKFTKTTKSCIGQPDAASWTCSPGTTCIAFSKVGSVEASGINTGMFLHAIKTLEWCNPLLVAISTRNDLVAMVSRRNTIGIWQRSTGDCLGTFDTAVPNSLLSFRIAGGMALLATSGVIELNTTRSMRYSENDLLRHGIAQIGIETTSDGHWVTWYGKPLILIPQGYTALVQGSSVLLKFRSERLGLMVFDPDKLASVYPGSM